MWSIPYELFRRAIKEIITFLHELNGAGQQGLSADPYKVGVTNFSIMQRVFLFQSNKRPFFPAQPVGLGRDDANSLMVFVAFAIDHFPGLWLGVV